MRGPPVHVARMPRVSFKTTLVDRGYFWPETTIWRQLAWRCGVDEDELLPVLLALLLNSN